jgi:DNA-binding MarR family transcriptional regulator
MNIPTATTRTSSPGKSVMSSLLAAAHALEARLEEALAVVGLSPPKFAVLSQLAQAGEPLTLSELAARVCCVRSNMTQLVDRLEAEGLVRRVDDPEDRRIVRAALTALGEKKQADGAHQMNRIQSELASALPEDDRVVLERVLSALK